MAVSGATGGAGAGAAAAAAAQAEAQRRAEEARRAAEQARKAAEQARKAAEAAQAAAQQRQAAQAQNAAQKLGQTLQGHKPETKGADEAKQVGASLEAQQARTQKERQAERDAQGPQDGARRAGEEAAQAQRALEAGNRTQQLTERARDLGEEFAQRAISDASKSLGKRLRDATVEQGEAALTGALKKGAEEAGKEVAKEAGKEVAKEAGKEVAKAAGKEVAKEAGKEAAKAAGQEAGKEVAREAIGEEARKIGEAFDEEARANLREALGRGAEQVLRSPEITHRLKDAAERAGKELSGEAIEQGARAAAGAGLGAQLKDALGSTKGVGSPAVATLEAKQKKEQKPKSAEEAGRKYGEERAEAIRSKAEKELGKPLSEASATEADKALKEAAEKETQKLPKDALEDLPGKGSPEEKARQFAKSYADSQRDALEQALGPKNASYALKSEAGQALAAKSSEAVKEAATAAKLDAPDKLAQVASKAAFKPPTADESAQIVRTAQREGGNAAASHALEVQLRGNQDPDVQSVLADKLRQDMNKWMSDMTDNHVTDGDRETMQNLVGVGKWGSPEVTQQVGRQFAEHFPDSPEEASYLHRELYSGVQDASMDAGSVEFLREAGTAMAELGKTDAASLTLDDAKFAIEGARDRYDEKQDKVDELNGRLNNYLASLGPSLSDKDRDAIITRFHEKHDDAYAQANKAAEPVVSMTEEIGDSHKRLPRGEGTELPAADDFRKEQEGLLKDLPRTGQTPAGKKAIGEDLARQGRGEPSQFVQAAKDAKLGTDFTQKFQAVIVQSVSHSALEAARNGNPGFAKQMLDGLRKDASLFGYENDPAKFNKIVDGLQGVAAGKKNAVDELGTELKGVTGGSGQALRGLGAALDLVGNIDNYKNWGALGVQKRIETLNQSLGLAGDAGKLFLDVVGSESKTLASIFEKGGKASGFFGGVLGAVQAFADFKKGDVFGGVIGTGSAALAIGGALGVVPGGAAVSLAVFGAQSIYNAIKNEKTQNEREDELKELIQLTDLKGLKPEVLDLLTHDGDPWRLRDLTQAAQASGQNPKESLEYLNNLSEDELKLLDQRLETQKGIGESKQEKLTPSDTALLKRRYGPDAVITETNRQLERKDLSEQERLDLENLKEFAERAKATRGHGTGPDGEPLPDSELLTGYPFQSKEGLGLDLMYRGFFEPPFQQAH